MKGCLLVQDRQRIALPAASAAMPHCSATALHYDVVYPWRMLSTPGGCPPLEDVVYPWRMSTPGACCLPLEDWSLSVAAVAATIAHSPHKVPETLFRVHLHLHQPVELKPWQPHQAWPIQQA